MPKIIISNKVYIPWDTVDQENIVKNYTHHKFENRICNNCEYRYERPCGPCVGCSGFLWSYKTYKHKIIGGTEYVGLPLGDKKNIEKKAGILYSDYKIKDKRVEVPLDKKIKFTLQLRPVQEETEKQFLKYKYGIICLPPRSGKTGLALSIAIKLGQRTLVLANQYEFLTQFLDHIYGNEKEGIPKCTNIEELEERYGRKLAGIPKTEKDFKEFQFICIPYQALISKKGKKRLKWLKANVGTVFIDEIHKASATIFSKVVDSLKTKYRFGCTATHQRKDGKDFLIKEIVGPVVAENTIETMTPKVYVHTTPVEGKYFIPGPATWPFAMQYLAKHKKRNEQIVEQVVKDLKAGYNILIPVLFKKHVAELVDAINKSYGSHICEPFLGGGTKKNKDQRKDILSRSKANEIRCIVGIRSLLQLGLNVPSWNLITEIMPISNKPNLRQETARICTPVAGKKQPIIRLFVDLNQVQSSGCARTSIRHMLEFGYKFSKKGSQQRMLYEIMSTGKRTKSVDDDTKINTLFKDRPKKKSIKRL